MTKKTIAIQMKNLMAGPDGVVQPGQVIQVSPEKAGALIEGGFAEPYKQAPEAASIEPPEKTIRPAPKRKAPAPPKPEDPKAELVNLVGDKPGKALIDAGINSIAAALEAIAAGVDLTEISGVGAGTAKKLGELLEPEKPGETLSEKSRKILRGLRSKQSSPDTDEPEKVLEEEEPKETPEADPDEA